MTYQAGELKDRCKAEVATEKVHIVTLRLDRPNDLRRVNLAFMTANGIASVVFAVFVIADMFI
jgi:hypothetical protein